MGVTPKPIAIVVWPSQLWNRYCSDYISQPWKQPKCANIVHCIPGPPILLTKTLFLRQYCLSYDIKNLFTWKNDHLLWPSTFILPQTRWSIVSLVKVITWLHRSQSTNTAFGQRSLV
jgi:hypothetical protein